MNQYTSFITFSNENSYVHPSTVTHSVVFVTIYSVVICRVPERSFL